MSDWIILRTAASRTVGLAKALRDAGYDAWTPVETISRRVGRKREQKDVAAPLTPSIVFAPADRLADLLALSHSPSLTYQVWDAELGRMVARGVPYFTVFRYLDAYPRISDRNLDPLRLAEQHRAPRAVARIFAPGEIVSHPGCGFDGLVGTVQESKGRYALVCFPGLYIPVKIEARHLLSGRSAA